MRHFKTTIIAVICLFVAIAAIFVVKEFFLKNDTDSSTGSTSDSSTGSQPNESTSVTLFSRDSDLQVTKIECNNEEFFSLYYADDRWNISSHTDLKVYDSSVDTFVNSFFGLKGNIIKDFESLSDFGFDIEPKLYTSIHLEDGTVYTLYFGITDNKNSVRFVMIDGVEDTVYSVGSYSVNQVMMTKEHLVSLYAMSFSSGYNPSDFFIYKNGDTLLQAKGKFVAATTESEKDSLTWTVVDPLNIAADNEKLTTLVNSLRGIPLYEMYDGNCEDLSQYGLDNPAIVYSLMCENSAGNKETRSISIGYKTEDATKYYCTLDSDKSFVYTIETSKVMVDVTIEDYIDGKVFYTMYNELSTIKLTRGNSTHTMKFVFGDNDSEERFFDGVFVHTEDSYADEDFETPEDKFNHLLTSLYLISITTVDTNEPVDKGELLLKIEYNLSNGQTVTVECFERDDRTAYLYKDGEYFGGYMETAKILNGSYKDYGVISSIDALVAVMK